MRRSGPGVSMNPRVRSLRALIALGVVAVLSASQGVEHVHASRVDAAQCAVCNMGKAEPASPQPEIATLREPVEAPEIQAPVVAPPVLPEPHGTPPARGPPSAA